MKAHECIDCIALPAAEQPKAPRPAPHGGPRSRRCTTHHRVHKTALSARTHETYVGKTYGLVPGEYARLLAVQGGKCAICQRASGKARRLAVDHDHDTNIVRGLLCKPCNRTVLGHGGDVLRRALAYLDNPPAARLKEAS